MKQNSMLTGAPIKSIVRFSLPIMASSLLQYNYTLVDNILVGRYVSTDALAAVGGVGSINSFIVGAALGLTSGFTIPVAQAFGAKDQNKINRFAPYGFVSDTQFNYLFLHFYVNHVINLDLSYILFIVNKNTLHEEYFYFCLLHNECS